MINRPYWRHIGYSWTHDCTTRPSPPRPHRDHRAGPARGDHVLCGRLGVRVDVQPGSPPGRHRRLDNSDVGGHHVALYVDDLDAAVKYLRDQGVRVLGEPSASKGPSLGQRWVYFLSPWGDAVRAGPLPRRQSVRPRIRPNPRRVTARLRGQSARCPRFISWWRVDRRAAFPSPRVPP